MSSLDSFKTLNKLNVNGKLYFFYDLNVLANRFRFDLATIPACKKILLENLVRNEDGTVVTVDLINNFCKQLANQDNNLEISFFPTRVLMQDFTGVPAIADLAAMRYALKYRNIDPQKINPLSRVDLIIDHSVMVDSFGRSTSYQQNVEKEFLRNKERYEFLNGGKVLLIIFIWYLQVQVFVTK